MYILHFCYCRQKSKPLKKMKTIKIENRSQNQDILCLDPTFKLKTNKKVLLI